MKYEQTAIPNSEQAAIAEIVSGLQQTPKHLPCKLFYDEVGAALFEKITELPEYYPTRTELEILQQHGDAMAEWIGPHARIVEFGSGSGSKTRVLLDKLIDPGEYIPIDIAESQLLDFARALKDALPAIRVNPIAADYTRDIALPRSDQRTIVFFPGSTIGNFEPGEAAAFLRNARRIAGERGGLLIGADLQKDTAVIERAYNDAAGVTAAFNLNILSHVNHICDADFDPGLFRHHAFYDAEHGRVEMQLISRESHVVTLRAAPQQPLQIDFASGERIVTEYAYKYTITGFQQLAQSAGFKSAAVWTDPAARFSVHAFDVT